MATMFHSRPLILFAGDILSFTFALWLTLFLRTLQAPSRETFLLHLEPFLLLFFIWIGVFVIAGLYESRSVIFARRALSVSLLVAQTINVSIAALFFFFVPLFGIAPKTILLIYLLISFLVVLLWRVVLFPWLRLQRIENTIIVGSSKETEDLVYALERASYAPARVMEVIDPNSTPVLSKKIKDAIAAHGARFIIADFKNTHVAHAFPELYNFLTQGIRFFDVLPLHEQIFGRIPLSILDNEWLARNVSRYAHILYDTVKRVMDIFASILLGAVALVLWPFIVLAIKMEDGGPAVISMPRVGEGGKVFNFYKFRSMSGNDHGDYGADGTTKLEVTRVGRFLRATRLDELPQLWNILRGELSLIGPRPELPRLVEVYEKEIPYYGVRHLIKPGLSGWAQLYHHSDPHHRADFEETKMKLSYDLYYLKHRSLALDALIALKTIRRLLIKSNA